MSNTAHDETALRPTASIDRWTLDSGRTSSTLASGWQIRALQATPPAHLPQNGLPPTQAAPADWLDSTVPSHWQQHPQLATHVGRVAYRCQFATPDAPAGSRVWLRINGAFYWSEPSVNGSSLGQHAGYFVPCEREIGHLLHAQGDNTLHIEVNCPDERDKFNKRMIMGVFAHWDCFDVTANAGGIWLPVEIITTGPARVQTVRCHTDFFDAQIAQLRYRATVDMAEAGPVLLRWRVAPRTFAGETQIIEQRRTLRQGVQQISGMFKIHEPRLWWTHDLGRPDLYTITLEVLVADEVSDRQSFLFGVRRFELRDWIPHLNGVRFLIKGNNYPPGDVRLATMNTERCLQDVQLARACHMNFLRVHAHVDHPALYAAADEMGILLWQDMPLQWLYRAEVLPEAQKQARQMVALLYNHPSVAIWCMHNEPVVVVDTADERWITRLHTYSSAFGFNWNRDVLDTELKRATEREDPTRPVVRSSGEFALPWVREGTDAHLYFGWYASYGTLDLAQRVFRRMPANLRFVTEFGAQSFPNVESCHRFMPAEMAEIDFAYLQARHSFQGNVMAKWLAWQEATTLQELVALTQDYQIFINRYYIDRLRYAKYRPTGGIVPFLFCDPYPAILWSVLDYWRVPKRSYYAMRDAFSPQYVFTLYEPRPFGLGESIELPIYAVNDAQQPVHGAQLAIQLHDPGGAPLGDVVHSIDLEADCPAQEIDRLRLSPTQTGIYTLNMTLTGVHQIIKQTYTIVVQ